MSREPGSESGQQIEDVESAVSASYTGANLGLALPWGMEGLIPFRTLGRLSCGFSLGASITHDFYLIEHNIAGARSMLCGNSE